MDKKYTEALDNIDFRTKKRGLGAAETMLQNITVVIAQFLEGEGHRKAADCLLNSQLLAGDKRSDKRTYIKRGPKIKAMREVS